jgi:hypothetical protein
MTFPSLYKPHFWPTQHSTISDFLKAKLVHEVDISSLAKEVSKELVWTIVKLPMRAVVVSSLAKKCSREACVYDPHSFTSDLCPPSFP